MAVKIAGIEFDTVSFDAKEDVLDVQRGGLESAVSFGKSKEGDEIRFGADGEIVGIAIYHARARYLPERTLSITLPRHRVVATADAFGNVLAVRT